MNQNTTIEHMQAIPSFIVRFGTLTRAFFAGLLLPLGFAPFHLPGFAILSLALLFAQLRTTTPPFLTGFVFGLGFLGLGVSWVYVSIHEFGPLNALLSGGITLLFVTYLALYPGCVALLYSTLSKHCSFVWSALLFSALWCLGEYLRATLMGGFPWLLLGVSQLDTPLHHIIPILGVYGASFLTCLAATSLVGIAYTTGFKRTRALLVCLSILLLPSFLKNIAWTEVSSKPLSIAIIQANLSMRDKWDESLFWKLVSTYQTYVEQFVPRASVIVLPESAIPVPGNYVSDVLEGLHQKALKSGSAILLGIPEPTHADETYYYNTITTLGTAEGHYRKQHLVPFGEFIPNPFEQVIRWFTLPPANLKPGKKEQPLIRVKNHPIASLICYELAYPALLRKQLPEAEWIVSVSDDGWFGHSLAMYQQLQIAQLLSLQTGRFQVVSNNDGLSSIINTKGEVTASLPAFSSGVLEANIYPAIGSTPWVRWGDLPLLLGCVLVLLKILQDNYSCRKAQEALS